MTKFERTYKKAMWPTLRPSPSIRLGGTEGFCEDTSMWALLVPSELEPNTCRTQVYSVTALCRLVRF
jgi:hypothetical protein